MEKDAPCSSVSASYFNVTAINILGSYNQILLIGLSLPLFLHTPIAHPKRERERKGLGADSTTSGMLFTVPLKKEFASSFFQQSNFKIVSDCLSERSYLLAKKRLY